MEGRTTSVTEAIQLPEQPASGAVEIVPYGGDGFSAPHSVTTSYQTLASDASGGTNSLVQRLDPRYTQIVAFVQIACWLATVDVEARLELTCSNGESWIVGVTLPYKDPGLTTGQLNNAIWTPPAILCSAQPDSVVTNYPFLRVFIPNVDTQSLHMQARIYNFDKRARELTPAPFLLASVPRASSVSL